MYIYIYIYLYNALYTVYVYWIYSRCILHIKYMYIVHSEMNAIYNAAENGVSLKDSTIYTVGLPVCHDCAKGLIQVGIKRVVTPEIETPERWLKSLSLTEEMFKEADIAWDRIKL